MVFRKNKYLIVGIFISAVVVLQISRTNIKYDILTKIIGSITRNNSKVKGQCESGHIKNFHPICGRGCLKILQSPDRVTPVKPIAQTIRKKIKSMKGMLHHDHNIEAVYYLTKAQREFGIYGSVGEIGVYEGQYFSVMANWLDPDAGERLFICDIFGDPVHMKLKTYQPRNNMVELNLNTFNYSFFAKDEKRRIRLYNTSSLYLSKSVLLKPDMAVPAFRLFSVDGNHNYPFVLLDILTASCIIRDGGIIALDDTRNKEWPQIDVSLTEYFTHYGKDIFRPLLQIGLKMYLVTANWYERYRDWLEENNVPKTLRLVKESSEIYNVPGHHYIQSQLNTKYKHEAILTGNNANKRHRYIEMKKKKKKIQK